MSLHVQWKVIATLMVMLLCVGSCSPETPAKNAKSEKPAQEKPDNPEKPDKPEGSTKPEKPAQEEPDKPAKNVKPETPDSSEKPEKPEPRVPAAPATEGIIDHNDTDITELTAAQINRAKADLHIAYGHTSHGSQLVSGMQGLVKFANNGGKGLNLAKDIFRFAKGGLGGALDLRDRAMSGDLGHNGDIGWAQKTRAYLKNPANKAVNVIIWSWCGGCSDNTVAGMDKYLHEMTKLEKEYPGVTFVYMTGHLDHGQDANLKARNKHIRDYCEKNNKVLYDYADIESHDPDGKFYEFSNDNCDFFSGADGKRLGNWAVKWQASHEEGVDWYRCGSAHSKPLNANQKAYAAWALWVRIAEMRAASK